MPTTIRLYPNGDSQFLNEGTNMIVQTDADYVGYNNSTRTCGTTVPLRWSMKSPEWKGYRRRVCMTIPEFNG